MYRTVVLLFLLLGCRATSAPLPPADVHQSNLEVSLRSRSVSPVEKVSLHLSSYNEKDIVFRVFRLPLPALVSTSKEADKTDPRIQAIDLKGLTPIRAWKYPIKKIYPDKWMNQGVRLPRLDPGAYLIVAQGKVAEKRTWLVVTDIALVSQRSRQELLVYAVHPRTGRPIPGLMLTGDDGHGGRMHGATDLNGVWRTPYAETTTQTSNLWIYGERNRNPAFLISSSPAPPKPYRIYTVTDRPIYRPGNKVFYKGMVRQRFEANEPGGFVFKPYAGHTAILEVRDPGDALISRQNVKTNVFGSYEGSIQLAGEPALGTWRLVTHIGDFSTDASFEVKAYRKPEFAVTVQGSAGHFPGGSVVPVTIQAKYFFGRPVADARVSVTIKFEPEGEPTGDEPAAVEPTVQSQGITDADGVLKLAIKTQRLPIDRQLTVHAVVTDLSRRSEAGDGNVLMTAARFRLTMETDRSVYGPGDAVRATVHATDYEDKPVGTPVRVRLVETKTDSNHQSYKEISTRTIHTGRNGDAIAVFSLPRPGNLELIADAVDAGGNETKTENSIWVAGAEHVGADELALSLVLDRQVYKPGQVATVLINTSLTDEPLLQKPKRKPRNGAFKQGAQPHSRQAWALVTVQGERLYAHQVVLIQNHSTLVKVPITAMYGPSVGVNVTLIQDTQIYQESMTLSVPRKDDKLTVKVVSDQDQFKPGAPASYTLTTLDYRGAPVPAELSFGVVDASIYALAPDNAPPIESAFGDGQEVRVETDFSFADTVHRRAMRAFPISMDMPARMGYGGVEVPVRRHFLDTGYWNAFVTTDRDGVGHVSFTVPDNLTTWRATARGITLASQAGSATHDTLSTMPLLVRLELPRFYVQGDIATVSAIVHNYTDETRIVRVRMKAFGAELQDDAERTVTISENGQQRLDWKARITDPAHPEAKTADAVTPASLPGAVVEVHSEPTVRFTVSADGGKEAQDAMELTLPSMADGLKTVDVRTGILQGQTKNAMQDLSHLPTGASVTLTITPSLANAILDPLSYLTTYPYGCAEQTMSSFLPDIAVARAFKRLGYVQKVQPDLNLWVNLGLQKLYHYQHPDGGWNWWEADETDPDMTAYVLWGLIEARDAGFLVDPQRIQRGTDALRKLLEHQKEWSRRADWILTLAYADPLKMATPGKLSAVAPIMDLYDHRDKLDAYGLASLALALNRLKDLTPPKFGTLALSVAHELEAKAVMKDTTVFWPAKVGGYTWRSDDVTVTAHVMRAIVVTGAGNLMIPQAVRWLMANRSGVAWESTRSTAEAVYALAGYMERTQELKPDDHVRVSLDGKTVREFTVGVANVFDPPTVITFEPSDLAGHQSVEVSKEGPGVSYITTTIRNMIPSEAAKPIARGIATRRRFTVSAEDPSHAGAIPSGEAIDVDLEVTADANYRYVLLEDPIPAGCEVDENEEGVSSILDSDAILRPFSGEFGSSYVRREVKDNHVAFLCDSVPEGRSHFHYRLHAETPGDYRVLPSIATLVYLPEIRGNSAPVRATILER